MPKVTQLVSGKGKVGPPFLTTVYLQSSQSWIPSRVILGISLSLSLGISVCKMGARGPNVIFCSGAVGNATHGLSHKIQVLETKSESRSNGAREYEPLPARLQPVPMTTRPAAILGGGVRHIRLVYFRVLAPAAARAL